MLSHLLLAQAATKKMQLRPLLIASPSKALDYPC
jgi:hypothetical protein